MCTVGVSHLLVWNHGVQRFNDVVGNLVPVPVTHCLVKAGTMTDQTEISLPKQLRKVRVAAVDTDTSC